MTVRDELFEKLANVEDARLCLDIDDAACRVVPGNFLRILGSTFLTKLGDAIISPKTTLAWLTTALGAPAVVLALLVPIRESGSMIPQLFIGGMIRQRPVRKTVWALGSVLQAACVAGLGLTALTLEGAAAGAVILLLITIFSLARGLCSVASKDVLGKTIPKKVRGQLTGWAASGAGLVTLLVGLGLALAGTGNREVDVVAALLLGAAGLWLVAAAVYARVDEHAGETDGARSASESLRKLGLLASDAPFRRFVLTRALLMCSALSAPFYVALAQERLGTSALILGQFVIASGAAALVSAPIWGRFADRSSKQVMVSAALLTAGTGIAVAAGDYLAPELLRAPWLLPVAYFVLSVAHSGVRVGRKTYLVDLAKGNRRTDYTAISNTLIGILLLLAGLIGSLAGVVGASGVLAILSAMGLAGALLGTTLKAT